MKTNISKENAIKILENAIRSRQALERFNTISVNTDDDYADIYAYTNGIFNIDTNDENVDELFEVFAVACQGKNEDGILIRRSAEHLYYIYSQLALAQSVS